MLWKVAGESLPGPVRLEHFDWPAAGKKARSARNSHVVRWEAALAFRQYLDRVLTAYPSAGHYIICHSHGGTVALLALRDYPMRNRIRGVFCLSTPFIQMRMRPGGRMIQWTVATATAFLSVSLVAFLLWLGPPPGWSLGRQWLALACAAVVGWIVSSFACRWRVGWLLASAERPACHRILQMSRFVSFGRRWMRLH
jgi:hypothetical protein